MSIQILTRLATIYDFVVALPEPIQASSRDYGFDFDEEDLARELHTPVSTGYSMQRIPDVGADEFESRYLWFPS